MSSSGPVLARHAAAAPSVSRTASPWLRQLIFLAIAAAGVLPFLCWGNFVGHDYRFFSTSWMEVARQWTHGVLWPKLAVGAAYGAGEPRFLFYPPVSWIVGGLLSLVLPLRLVPGLYVFACLFLAANTMFRLASEWLSSEDATIAATLFALNPYLLYNALQRSAFAELLASSLLPLLLVRALRLMDDSDFAATRNFALIFALVWLTDVPASIIFSYAMATVVVVEVIRAKSWRPLVRFAGGSALAAGVAAFYWLPVLWERTWINSISMITESSEWSGSHLLNIEAGAIHPGYPMTVLLGVAVSEVAATLLLFATLRRAPLARAWLPLVALAGVTAMAVLSPGKLIWNALPLMPYVQFSWRWLTILAVPLSMAGAIAMGKLPRRLVPGVGYAALIAAVAVFYTAAYQGDGYAVARLDAAALALGRGYPSTLEYQPAVQPSMIGQAEPVTLSPAGVQIAVIRWEDGYKRVRIVAPANTSATFRVTYFPAWRATVNGRATPTVQDRESGLVQVSVSAGENDVELRFMRTRDRTVGWAISLFAGAGVIACSAVRRKRRA